MAQRWDAELSINLYYCEDEKSSFFVEIGIDDGCGQAVVLRSSVSIGQREDYALGLRLPGE